MRWLAPDRCFFAHFPDQPDISLPPTCAALAYIVLDTLIIHLPVSRSLILKYFNPSSNTRAAQTRLVGQVAARTVGCVFLAMMFPSAIRTLLDPTMRVSHESELYHTSEDSFRCIQVAAAYFIYDTYICTFRYAENGFPFLVHAVLCCMAYLYPLFTGNMHYQGANFLCWECSTPFLYLRWATIKGKFFRSESKKKAWQNASNVLFAMAFFVCRVVSGPWQSWAYFQASGWDLARGDGAGISSTVTWAYRSAMLVLNGLNFWWFSAIMRVALGKGSGEQTEQKD